MSKARPLPSVQVHALRHEPWGRVSLVDDGQGGPLQLIEKWKVQPAGVAATAAWVQRWQSVAHPSVLAYAELEADAGTAARQARATSGPSLQAVLTKAPRLSPKAAAALFADLGEALLALHAQGLVAGSVDLPNLVVCPVGHEGQAPLVLLHAGLTQLLQSAGTEAALPWPVAMHEVAPELAAGQWPTAATDVFQLAACLAQSLGEPPPELAPWLAACRDPEPSNRVASLSGLVEALHQMTSAAPRIALGDHSVVAAWVRGSPMLELAAWLPTEPWYKAAPVPSLAAGPLARPSPPSPSPSADARVQAALKQLRGLSEAEDVPTGWRVRRNTLILLAVLGLVMAWLASLQVAEMRRAEADYRNAVEGLVPRPPPPPRPRPRMLTPEDGVFGP